MGATLPGRAGSKTRGRRQNEGRLETAAFAGRDELTRSIEIFFLGDSRQVERV
jgi:hypothetical protein